MDLLLDQGAINAAMLPWGDVEFTRFAARIGLFRRRGATPAEAELWADRLALRDQQLDDRRVCIECAHRQDDRGCFAASQGWIKGASRRMQVIPFFLQRCEAFRWAKP